MRTTIVPAQITTVEDKIAGSLGLSQILLLISPIFDGSAIFVILPPFFNYALYKVVLISIGALLCGILAVRIKGKILASWITAILRYNLRPAYYVFNKNSSYARETPAAVIEEAEPEAQAEAEQPAAVAQLSTAERLQATGVIADPAADVRFTTTKKGELRVIVNEIAHESIGTAAN